MKTRAPLSCAAFLVLAACGGAQKPAVQSAETTSASIAQAQTVEAPAPKSAAEAWAESKVAKDDAAPRTGTREALDPLSEGAAMEAASIPKIEKTDKKLLRPKSRGELDAALSVVKTAASVDEAATKITARIGKPSWTENGQKRIWVAMDGARCHRLVLEGDGSVSLETVAKKDVIRLTTTARQDPCTGDIEKGGAQ